MRALSLDGEQLVCIRIGERLDGWANRDLNVGTVVALSPNLQPVADLLGVSQDTVRTVLQSWGPGEFDAELFLDGKAFRPDGKTAAIYHDGRFATVRDVVEHYNTFLGTNLTGQQKLDLVEYLKSL